MGQKLCCFRPSTTENQPQNTPRNPKETNSLSDDRFLEVETIMTLEDCLISSPALNPQCNIRAGEIPVLKQPNKVYPSSPDFSNTHFYTPRMSFSSGKLEKIDEFGEEDEEEVSIISRSGQGTLKKKVTFKLPEEADMIIFYSPTETFY